MELPNDYRLLNEYSVLGPSSLVGIWSRSLRDIEAAYAGYMRDVTTMQ